MVRFDKIFEQWAKIYRPLSHSDKREIKHRSFYRIDTLNTENEFVRNVATAVSPCMAYSTLIDAQASPKNSKQVSYLHTIYFLIKQKSVGGKTTFKTSDEEACECKVDLNDMCEDFFVFLSALSAAANRNATELVIGNNATEGETERAREADPHIFVITADIKDALRGIDLTTVRWGSLPQFKNGWWIVSFQFEMLQPRQLCIIPERYN